MDLLANLQLGFATALGLQNLLYALCGCVLGTLIGVLPGLGPVATVAMLLPVLHGLDVTPALILLAGIHCGAQYGGSTAAILTTVPGGRSAADTAIDGDQMVRQGRAGAALATAGLGSFFAGCVGTLILAVCAPPLTELAFRFGPAEYFSLMVLGLIGAVVLASGSLAKAIAMTVLGLLLGQVHGDASSGAPRFGVDIPELADGISLVAVAIGVFGFGEIIANLGRPAAQREVFAEPVGALLPTREDFRLAWPAVLRGTALGALLGVLPGGGALLASFAAYTLEKQVARDPSRFGRGAIEGVAAPESAHQAGAQASFIPMLTLGIPPNAVMALIVGAMAIKGIRPGPQLMTGNPQLFWGLIASMWIANVMLLVLNLPLMGLWVRLLSVPYRCLFPAVLTFCCIGLYTLHHSNVDIVLAAGFGLLGHVVFKLGCEPAPLLLGFVLGPVMEENLRRALLLSGGDWSTFVTRGLSAGLLLAAVVLVLVVSLPTVRSQRDVAFQDVE